MRAPSAVRNLVLLGGGHTHVHILKSFGLRPMPGVRITLIARDADTPYSGMLPGFIAGHYTHEQCHIDLRPLARFAGAHLIHDEAIGLDTAERRVSCRAHAPVAYDIVSIDIGSTPHLGSIPGALQYATPVKPIDGLAARWAKIVERTLDGRYAPRFLTVGGGAAGVELTLAMRYRLRALLSEQGRDPDGASFTLVTRGQLLPSHNPIVRHWFRRAPEGARGERHRAQRRVRGAAGRGPMRRWPEAGLRRADLGDRGGRGLLADRHRSRARRRRLHQDRRDAARGERSDTYSPPATWRRTSTIRAPKPACSRSGRGRRWLTISGVLWPESRWRPSSRRANSCR